MDKIQIIGGTPLRGTISISGAKNAALPLMAASLLTDQSLVLKNVPRLADIQTMKMLLGHHGTAAFEKEDCLTLQAKNVNTLTAPYDIVRKMRASILVLGPLVARCREAYVSLPGGCAIGTRPIDLHLKGLSALGADVTLEDGYVHVKAPRGLVGADYTFPVVSVTGTENLLMAACLAKGTTRLINAALEPEIGDLAMCLNAMGGRITGINTGTLVIEGVEGLSGATHTILSDRIEAGSYAMAAALTGGTLELLNASLDLIPTVAPLLREAGVLLQETENGFRVEGPNVLKSVDITTDPFPGFATDLQAQFMALMTLAEGASSITETIFENRFMHVPELCRLGANITVHGNTAIVKGVAALKGAPVMATDLRASISLVIAALAAEGETAISRVYHLDRGYSEIEKKLSACGAHIKRLI